MKMLDYLRIIKSMLGDIKRSFKEKKGKIQDRRRLENIIPIFWRKYLFL